MAKNTTAGWNPKTQTGWKKEGNKWVQYLKGRKTGQTRKHKLETNVLGSAVADSWRKVTSGNPTAKTGDNRSKLIAKNKSKGGGAANAATRTTNKSKPSVTWKDMKKAGVLDKKTTKPKSKSSVTWKDMKKAGVLDKKTTKPKSKSTVHTRHYKTGKALGVMTRSQRRAYDKEAAGRTFESEVAKHEKSSGHGKAHLRETKYKASLRKSNKNKLKTQQAALKAGKIEREEQEWGPGGQPSASKQLARMKKKKKPWHSYLKTNLGHSLL